MLGLNRQCRALSSSPSVSGERQQEKRILRSKISWSEEHAGVFLALEMHFVYCFPKWLPVWKMRCFCKSLRHSRRGCTQSHLLKCYFFFLANSKAIPRIRTTSTVAKSAKTPNQGSRSWSTTSTFLQTRKARRASRPWTPTTPACCSSSSCSCSCRSWASSSSTTTTRPSCRRRSSTRRGGAGPAGDSPWVLMKNR